MTSFLPHHYVMLGLGTDASSDDVRTAFRAQVQRWHPDVLARIGLRAETTRMVAISEAFEVLSDPERRAIYDTCLKDAVEARLRETTRSPVAKLVDRLIGIRESVPPRGRHRRLKLEVPLVDSFRDTETSIDLEVSEACSACLGDGIGSAGRALVCPQCVGIGEVFHSDTLRSSWQPCRTCDQRGYCPEPPCASCKGRGEVLRSKRFVIPVPSGVESGTILKVRGAGESGIGGGPPGDLLVEITISPDPYFSRRGLDLFVTRPMPMWVTLTGGTVNLPTPQGLATIRVPAGLADREVLKLAGWGFDSPSGPGDVFVTVSLEWPESLSEEERELIRTWASSLPVDRFPETRRFELELLSRRDST